MTTYPASPSVELNCLRYLVIFTLSIRLGTMKKIHQPSENQNAFWKLKISCTDCEHSTNNSCATFCTGPLISPLPTARKEMYWKLNESEDPMLLFLFVFSSARIIFSIVKTQIWKMPFFYSLIFITCEYPVPKGQLDWSVRPMLGSQPNSQNFAIMDLMMILGNA